MTSCFTSRKAPALCLFLSMLGGCTSNTTAHLSLDGALLEADMPRYGLNLGGSGTWGAEQLRANVLSNPGFEPVLDRTLLILKEATPSSIVDDSNWLARPDGFWNGATFDIRSGAAAGQEGRIVDSRIRPKDGFGEFWLDIPNNGLRAGDVVSLTIHNNLKPAPQWWPGKGRIANAPGEGRPGSAGKQALRLLALPGQPAEILYYLDNISERAGKLLPVQGKWRLEFWARAPSSGARLHAHFDRVGSPTFFDTVVNPGAVWQHYSFEFEAVDTGRAGVLTLGLTAQDGEIMIDDAYLGEANSGAGGFRHEVVQTLKTLNPGYLRDWQGQLGDTLDNRLADEHSHQPVRYRPGDNETQFHYSLPDFLALCSAVGAQPWIVAPTTLNDEEWQRLGAWLRQAADRYKFREVMLEFGNENWNLIFRPGGIPDIKTHAAVADRAFRLLKIGSQQDARIHTVINAQFVNPDSPLHTGAASHEAERVAVASYFLYRLNAGTPLTEAHQAAFGDSAKLLQQEAKAAGKQNKRLVIYEVNFHTTLGDANATTRNAVVTGAASGTALARRLVQGTLSGVREQAVYTLAGFDSYLQEGKGLVHLWGITRDLSIADRLRPTGLALELLNRVAKGAAHAVHCKGKPCTDLISVSFAQGQQLAIVSASSQPSPVSVSIFCPNNELKLDVLDGSKPELNNEQTVEVHIVTRTLSCQSGQVLFTLPAHSLAVLHP